MGDEAALGEFAAWAGARRERLLIAYASGRFVASILKSVAATALPQPDAAIGGVGTEIHLLREERSLPLLGEAAERQWDPEAIRSAVRGWPGMVGQPDEFQSRHKLSFFLDDASAEQLAALSAMLRGQGQDVDVIYSSRRDVDIVPRGVNKGSAARRVAQTWGVRDEDVIVGGDSANDLALYEQGFRGIVVGNAHAELKALRGDGVYLARGSFAAGMLEGLQYWLGEKERR